MQETRATELPAKLFFRIGEVAALVGVEPHVLRYWEREFRAIRPTKSARGQRVYSRRDVENLMRVRDLLYREGFTIAGARKRLARAGHMSAEDAGTPESRLPLSEAAPAAHAAASSLGPQEIGPQEIEMVAAKPAAAEVASRADGAAYGGPAIPPAVEGPPGAGKGPPVAAVQTNRDAPRTHGGAPEGAIPNAGTADALARTREELFAIRRDIEAFLAELDAPDR